MIKLYRKFKNWFSKRFGKNKKFYIKGVNANLANEILRANGHSHDLPRKE